MDKYRRAFHIIRSAVALAMGVAVVVLSILRTTDEGSLITLLGIGLFALGVDALNRD